MEVSDYLDTIPLERKEAFNSLRDVVLKNLPIGFKEVLNYGMLGYVVPHELYPFGYHVNPLLPLPFINLASQKKHISLYHMGIYSDAKLLDWFVGEYAKISNKKLNMGKSCIRFSKIDKIPYELIGELCSKMTVEDWVGIYENAIKKK
ncbi:MAG: DUF1801 domain-containing protein [Flavobacteriales bacterium]|jgi:hypothetical protein|nr:DUF1801 domain-containing protein [Flavobacteriales bacterium]